MIKSKGFTPTPKSLVSGFTLIELLVVIAIIGVLSSIVLVSLNNARDRGNDAKIKANISGLRSAAELYYMETNFTYGIAVTGGTAAPTTIGAGCGQGMFASSRLSPYTLLSNYPTTSSGRCTSDGTNYAVSVKLNGAGFWCVDNRGASRPTGALQGTSVYQCPTS